jgi:hypothetical protein
MAALTAPYRSCSNKRTRVDTLVFFFFQCVVLAADEFQISMLGVSLDWLLAILDL